MDKYIYFVSQLPALLFDQEPLITVENFLVEAEKWLSGKDLSILSDVSLTGIGLRDDDPDVLRLYKITESEFLDELVRWRKTRESDQEYKPRTFSVAALKEGTPLDAERRLLLWKWDLLDRHEHEHHFDLEFLIIYFLKLQILHRLVSFNTELGLQNYHSLCEAEV